MRSLKFAKVDYMTTRKQIKLMLFIIAIALVFAHGKNDGSYLAGMLYLVFIGNVFCNALFVSYSTQGSGFVLLLPGDIKHRICGRFLFGISYISVTGMIYLLLCVLTGIKQVLSVQGIFLCMVLLFAGLIINDMEYAAFYIVGETKGQITLSLLRVLPPLCFYFISFYFINHVMDVEEAGSVMLNVLYWISDHMALCAALLFGLMVVVTFACIRLCTVVTEKRDFA